MKRKQFEYTSTFMKLSEDTVNAALKEAMQFSRVLEEIMEAIPKMQEVEDEEDPDEFLEMSFGLLDWIIDESEKLSVDNLADLLDYPIASTGVLMKRSAEINRDIATGREGMTRSLAQLLDSFCDVYSFPSGDSLKMLWDKIYFYLGQMGYFMYYQYDLHLVGNGVVSEPVYQYSVNEQESVEDVAAFWEGLIRKFRPNLTVFEEFPELEDDFWEVAGAYLNEFDFFEDLLTKEDVLAILAPGADVVTLLGQVVLRGGRG